MVASAYSFCKGGGEVLKIATSMRQLPFQQLMEIYQETNIRSAQRHWSAYSPERGLAIAEDRFYEELQCGFFSIPHAMYCLWMVEGECVSALRLEPWQDGWLLAALETAPDRRKQGHAQALLRAVQGYLSAQGAVKLDSHIHFRNKASIHVHEACGFRKITDTAKLLDGTITTQMSTYHYQDNTPVVY